MTMVRRIALNTLLGFSFITAAHADDLILQAATQNHPHIRALIDGRVKAQGFELHLSTRPLSELNQDLQGAKQWDVAEVDLVTFLERRSAGELSEYELIPVFLSREFQLRNIYIRTDRGIHSAGDLRGKTIGISGRGSATPTWVRGILSSSWSIKPEEITWLDTETSTLTTRSLSDWIQRGQVDAVLSPVPLRAYMDKNPKVARLFENYYEAEYETFRTSRIFPIHTVLAIRRKIAEENPWICESLFKAFSESKQKAMAEMTLPLPWEGPQLLETEELMGKNFWSFGVKSNPKTLGALFNYLQEQGLLKNPLKMDDVFESSTMMLLED